MNKIRIEYLAGTIMGTATFLNELTPKNGRRAIFRCKCGNIFEAMLSKVVAGRAKGCGCGNVKHGQRRGVKNGIKTASEYMAWVAISSRCYNTLGPDYMNYGGRGISVCDRWFNSFDHFLSDMGKRPSAKHSLDRIDVNGDYEPSNCRWATSAEQAKNKRNNIFLTYKSETKLLMDFAHEYGISWQTLYMRIFSLKWSTEKSLETNVRKIVFSGQYKKIK